MEKAYFILFPQGSMENTSPNSETAQPISIRSFLSTFPSWTQRQPSPIFQHFFPFHVSAMDSLQQASPFSNLSSLSTFPPGTAVDPPPPKGGKGKKCGNGLGWADTGKMGWAVFHPSEQPKQFSTFLSFPRFRHGPRDSRAHFSKLSFLSSFPPWTGLRDNPSHFPDFFPFHISARDSGRAPPPGRRERKECKKWLGLG